MSPIGPRSRCSFPSQLLTFEMLRRPIEFTLAAAVAVMNQTVRVWSRPEGLFEGVERDVCSQRVHDPPADDLS